MVTVEDKELVAALASFSLASSSPAPVAAAAAPAAGQSGTLADICRAYNIYWFWPGVAWRDVAEYV